MPMLRGNVILVFLLTVFFIVVSIELGIAQASTATLTGTAQDQTGAVLPNVIVTITNADRNSRRSTRTDELGRYILPALPPGNYSIAAELPGFKRFAQDGITL